MEVLYLRRLSGYVDNSIPESVAPQSVYGLLHSTGGIGPKFEIDLEEEVR